MDGISLQVSSSEGGGSPRQSKHMKPNRLCKRCSRALTTSKKLWQPRQAGDEPDWTSDKFFHSKNVKQMLEDSVVTTGCHLCTQVRLEDNFASAGDDHRVMIECSRQMTFQGDGKDIPIVSFSATSCADWDDNWASLPDPAKDGEPEGNSETIPLATFKLERADGSGALLPQRLPDGSSFALPCSTDSPEAFGLVRYWLNDCLNNHPGCKGSNFQRLPTRLVDVGLPDDNGQKKPLRPRIFLPNSTSQTPATIPYLTLSHSWALTGSSLRLTTKNVEEWQTSEGIPIDGLAQTFRDAMHITQQLGYRYIWIDSLCIMQDSPEDWNREAQTMAAVYGNSLLTIFASGMGMEGGQGTTADTCFSVRSNPLEVYAPIIRSPLPLSDDTMPDDKAHSQKENGNQTADRGAPSFYAIREQYQPSVDEMLWGAQQKNPLLSRGWIVQERLLSPRIIYYGADELYWECRLHAVSESCPFGTALKGKDTEASQSIWTANAKSVYQDLVQDYLPAGSGDAGMDVNNAKEDAKHLLELAACWTTLLTYYTATALTYPSDRLIALAGMVTAIAETKGWTYSFGGSWKELWPFDLLWGFSNVLSTEMFNPGWYPADSEKRQQERKKMDQKLLAGKSYPESQPSTKLGLPSWSWAATEAPKDFWFHSSADPPAWKCEVILLGETSSPGRQQAGSESGILALKTYTKQLYEMPPIDLVLMWDDNKSFYLKEEVCCVLVLDHLARGGRRALQVGLMVVEVQMAENAPSCEASDGRRRFYCRRVGKWENTWGPLAIDRSKDEEGMVYLC